MHKAGWYHGENRPLPVDQARGVFYFKEVKMMPVKNGGKGYYFKTIVASRFETNSEKEELS